MCWIGLFYFAFQDGQKVAAYRRSMAARKEQHGNSPPAGSVRGSSQALLLQISLTAFFVGGFFLSRTYTPPLYVYLGLTVAAAQVEAKQAGLALPGSCSRDWARIVSLTLASIVLVIVLVRL